MNAIRKKIFIVSILIILFVTLYIDYSSKVVFADNPNQKSTVHSLTGGWNKNWIGTSGKHWTKYDQINNGARVYASIELTGYQRETYLGTYTSAKVVSGRSVDYYHQHRHTGGMAK